ncbi:hypothetical protein ACTQ6A_08660 [Lachnospiraceae bacterium LCP25S3_G4]
MLMKSLWKTTARTDDEYRNVLKGRMKIWYVMSAIGIITLIVGVLSAIEASGHQASFLSGVYSGLGFGLIAVAIVNMIATRKLLKNDEKIRQKRLACQDERVIMISQKALILASSVILIGVYLGILVMGFFSLQVFWTLWVIIMAYAVVYLIARAYYERKL